MQREERWEPGPAFTSTDLETLNRAQWFARNWGTRAERARLDTDRNAEPRTRMVGHARVGDCVGPGSVPPDAIEDTRTGERTPLGTMCNTCGKPQATRFTSADGYCYCHEHQLYIRTATNMAMRHRIGKLRDSLPFGAVYDALTAILRDTARGADMPEETNAPPGGDTGAAEARGARDPEVAGSIPACSTHAPGGGSAEPCDHDWTVVDDESGRCTTCGIVEHWAAIVGMMQTQRAELTKTCEVLALGLSDCAHAIIECGLIEQGDDKPRSPGEWIRELSRRVEESVRVRVEQTDVATLAIQKYNEEKTAREEAERQRDVAHAERERVERVEIVDEFLYDFLDDADAGDQQWSLIRLDEGLIVAACPSRESMKAARRLLSGRCA